MGKYLVYHHNDIDGHAAAWNVLKHIESPTAESFIEMDYDSPFDQDHKDATVFIVDISFTVDTINRLIEIAEKAKKVIWIDHHHTSIEAINLYKDKLDSFSNLTYFVHEGICGAALTYLYFYMHKLKIEQAIDFMKIEPLEYKRFNGKFRIRSPKNVFELNLPNYLSLIDDWDCWKLYNPSSELFILGVEAKKYAITYEMNGRRIINYEFWRNIDKLVYNYIQEGVIIKGYLTKRYDKEIEDGFESEWEGETIFCMNSRGNSTVFGDKLYKYPFVVLFEFSGKHNKFVYSLYSAPIDGKIFDCSKLAEQFGGGGHPGASGFSSDKMIFLPK